VLCDSPVELLAAALPGLAWLSLVAASLAIVSASRPTVLRNCSYALAALAARPTNLRAVKLYVATRGAGAEETPWWWYDGCCLVKEWGPGNLHSSVRDAVGVGVSVRSV
jgi:hypothetical protein